ncbi:MAG: hypothetical protein LBV75_00285 [Paludibacter sp.]|jgi:tetratricopeptide (TPR) repeat protein|nr:hypothetical protein [Paludibacter sp.]
MSKQIYILLLFFSILCCAEISGQTAAEGEQLFNNGNYARARELYSDLLKTNQLPLYYYRLARCNYELGDYNRAKEIFLKTTEYNSDSYFYLGEIYFRSYYFDLAADAYSDFLENLPINDARITKTKQSIRRANLAQEMLLQTEDVAIIDSVQANKENFLDFVKFSKSLGTLSKEKNTDKTHYTTERNDRHFFSEITDKGTLDIFYSYKLQSRFSIPQALSDLVNTKGNESFPFLMLDGLTLYFASDGDNSIGGYDILVTRFLPASQNYLPPINIGMPYNSPDNDYMMIIDQEDGTGWFATDRRQPKDKVMLYHFAIDNVRKTLYSADSVYLRQRANLQKVRTDNRHLSQLITDSIPQDIAKTEIPKIDSIKPEIIIPLDTVEIQKPDTEVIADIIPQDTAKTEIPKIDSIKPEIIILIDTVEIQKPDTDVIADIVTQDTVKTEIPKIDSITPEIIILIDTVEIQKPDNEVIVDIIPQDTAKTEIPKIDSITPEIITPLYTVETKKPDNEIIIDNILQDTAKTEIQEIDSIQPEIIILFDTTEVQKPDTEIIADIIPQNTVKTEIPKIDSIKPEIIKTIYSEAIHIIINDLTIYLNKNQFKSSDALNYFNDYQQMTQLLQAQQKELENARLQYTTIEDNTEKEQLTEQILQLESSIPQLTVLIANKLQEVINTENRLLNENQ